MTNQAIMKKLTLLLILTIIAFLPAKSQDFGQIMQAGADDAQLYFEQYAGPVMASFTNGLGAGWYNTGKPHKLLGFDLTVGVNLANIPTAERTFNFSDVNWNNLQIQGANELPSVVGGSTNATLVIPANASINLGGGESISYSENIEFDALDGFDASDLPVVGFPVPTAQLGIGLPKNTDLKIRYFGANIEDASINMFGIGVLHDLKQWIPGLKQIPFDASGFIGYTSFTSTFDFEASDPNFAADGSVELSASSFTLQGVISKTLPVITPYIGIGVVLGSSSLDVKGDYTYTNTEPNTNITTTETVTDPISLDFDGGNSPRINAGLRLKLLILTIHAEYAIQKYNTFTAGVGLSIR